MKYMLSPEELENFLKGKINHYRHTIVLSHSGYGKFALTIDNNLERDMTIVEVDEYIRSFGMPVPVICLEAHNEMGRTAIVRSVEKPSIYKVYFTEDEIQSSVLVTTNKSGSAGELILDSQSYISLMN